LFKFDKVNATAPLIFSHLIIFSSGAALADIYEPVDNASGEIIIRFFKYIIPRLSKETRFHACQSKCYFGVCQSKCHSKVAFKLSNEEFSEIYIIISHPCSSLRINKCPEQNGSGTEC
jgi:hypothetical protein